MICTHYGNMDQNLRECFQYLFLFGTTHPAINAMAFRFREVFLVSGRQSLPNTHILKAWHCRKRVQLSLETSNCWASKNHVRICLLRSTLLVYISSTKNTTSKWSESTFSTFTLLVAQASILLIESVAFRICNALCFLLPNRNKSPRNNQCSPSASLTFCQHQLWVAHL